MGNNAYFSNNSQTNEVENQASSIQNNSDEVGLFENDVPLIGYTLGSNNSQIKIYSMKSERPKHILRFGSSVIKFQTSYTSKSNNMIVLL